MCRCVDWLFAFPGEGFDVQVFYFFAGPGCFAEEFEARFDAGIIQKTIDADAVA
jgi:hypothetical protein